MKGRQTDRQRGERETFRQTDRVVKGRQTDRQRGEREADRQTEG